MDNMQNILHRYAQVRALVIGDAMIDQYHFGRMDRISPEAPIGVYVEDYERAEGRRGGADNVAHQLEVLGVQVSTLFPLRRSCKHRYFVGHHQVFRRDSDSHEEPGNATFDALISALVGVNVVVLSDYAKGWLTHELCQAVMHQGIVVVVDPKGSDWRKYQGATVICPNSAELEVVNGYDPGCAIVEKRGPLGLRIRHLTPPYETFAARARSVYDVTGAGDTVVALVAATLAVGGSLQDACHLASLAAAEVVGKLGTAVCTKDELLASVCA